LAQHLEVDVATLKLDEPKHVTASPPTVGPAAAPPFPYVDQPELWKPLIGMEAIHVYTRTLSGRVSEWKHSHSFTFDGEWFRGGPVFNEVIDTDDARRRGCKYKQAARYSKIADCPMCGVDGSIKLGVTRNGP
jgi:hypothetical protein